MTDTKTMPERLLGRLTDRPQSFDQIAAGMNPSDRARASTTLSVLAKTGKLRRSGMPRDYRYARLSDVSATPNNPASGRCIDALSNLLRSHPGHLTRDEIIEGMPKGFAPHDVVGAMTDAIAAGWMVTRREGDHLFYVLSDDVEPEPHAPDPLALAFVPKSTRQRVDELQAELSALLQQQVGDHASPTVLHHIAAANYHLHQLHPFL